MEEVWKEIEGSDGLFSVSNEGRVRQNHYEYISLQGRKIVKEEKIIKPIIWQSKYLRVDISNRRKNKPFRKAVYVHKLVAEYFIGPRPEGYEIDHIDGNYLNNRADNLRYVTRQQNMNNPVTKKRLKNKTVKEETRQKISNTLKIVMNSPKVQKKIRKKHNITAEGIQRIHECIRNFYKSEKSIETRKKQSESSKNRCWVNDGNKNKFILKNELDNYIQQGYVKGFIKNKGK